MSEIEKPTQIQVIDPFDTGRGLILADFLTVNEHRNPESVTDDELLDFIVNTNSTLQEIINPHSPSE